MLKKIFSFFKKEQKKDFSLDIGITKALTVHQQPNNDYNNINIKVLLDIINKENIVQKRIHYMRKYLVVLDTTNRPEVKDRGLAGGLKNFYFVYAEDVNQAKVRVLATFARMPHIVEQIQYSLSVTPIDDILNTLSPNLPLWSYIPFSRSQRYPGQKSVPPGQNLNPNNRDEIIPIKPDDIPKPITPPSKNDVDVELLKESPKMKFNNTNNNNQDNAVELLKKLVSLLEGSDKEKLLSTITNNINNNQNNNDAQVNNSSKNERNDIEVQRRIMENLQNSRPKHINADSDPESFLEEELKAKQEVENFKNLPPQELEKIQQNILNSIIKEK